MTEQLAAPAANEYADPRSLVTGQRMPTKDHTFRTPDGTPHRVKLQGLSYAVKSRLDAEARLEKEEAERTGEAKTDLRGPKLIAEAVRNPDGSRPFTTDEEKVVYAISISEQMADGEISRGYNAVLELSGYGAEAIETAGKS